MKQRCLLAQITVFLTIVIITANANAECSSGGVFGDAFIPPNSGNWTIDSDSSISCEDVEIILNGNMTIDNGGILVFMANVTLIMNSTNTSHYILNNGSFEIYDSKILKGENSTNYYFISLYDLLLSESNLSDSGIDSANDTTKGLYTEGDALLLDSIFSGVKEIHTRGNSNAATNNVFNDTDVIEMVGNDIEFSGNIFDSETDILISGTGIDFFNNIMLNNMLSLSITGSGNKIYSNKIRNLSDGAHFKGDDINVSFNDFNSTQVEFIGNSEEIIGNNFGHSGCLLLNGVSESIIKDNVFTECTRGISVGTDTDSGLNNITDNTFTDNGIGVFLGTNSANTNIRSNSFDGRLANDHSVSGIHIEGNENWIISNSIKEYVYGIRVIEGYTTEINLTDITNSVFGIHFFNASIAAINNCNISGNDITDISSVSTTLSLVNTNYTTRYTNWSLSIVSYDSNNTMVSFTVSVSSESTDLYLIDEISSPGILTMNLPEYFEDKSLENDTITDYNPYRITVRNTELNSSNITYYNITSDMLIRITLNGTAEETPPENNGTIESFYISSYLPRNHTYIKNDFLNGVLRAEVRGSEDLLSCTYHLNGGTGVSMTNQSSKSFYSLINSTDFVEGGNRIYFRCYVEGGLTNTSDTVYLTVYPDKDCDINDDCLGSQYCNTNDECEDLDCGCGYASDHQCTNYECCENSECGSTEICSGNRCVAVSCECPERVKNHICNIPTNYCCRSTMCTGANQVCDMNINKCIEKVLRISLSENEIMVGENIIVIVKDESGVLVEGVDITLQSSSGNNINKKTDSTGSVSIEVPEAGTFVIIARKGGYAAAESSMVVKEGFDILIVIVIIIIAIGGAAGFMFLKSSQGSSKTPPVTMSKTIQGDNISLLVKNNTKAPLMEVVINDQVPKGAFISANIQPDITEFDANTDNLAWAFPSVQPGQQININYKTYKSMEGFSVRTNDQEYISD